MKPIFFMILLSYFLSFDAVFHFTDEVNGCGIDLVHCLILITRSIACKFAFIQRVDERLDELVGYLVLLKFFFDVVLRELRYRHAQLVADVAPQCLQNFIVECFALLFSQELACILHALGSHLVGLLGAYLRYIGIFDSLLAIDEHERYEQGQWDDVPQDVTD